MNTRRAAGVAHISVAKPSLPRALRLLQGLFAEVERRGYQLTITSSDRTCAGGAGVAISGHAFEVVLGEERTRVPHRLTTYEQSRPSTYQWAPRWDYIPSGRLQLRIGHDSYLPPLATDRKRWRIEERLGQALERLESAAAEAETRRLERERAEEARRVRHQHELERQRREQLKAHRAEYLTGQVTSWRLAAEIHAFVHEARTVVDPEDTSAVAWLDWALDYAERIDPLVHPIAFPNDPEPLPGSQAW